MAAAGEIAVRARGVRKSYGALEALAGVDIEIRRGEVFGLLGPNGAGKTTLVEILEGHRKRDGGEANVLGFDPHSGERALREQIGIVLQEEGVDGVLTVREAVEIYSASYPHPRRARMHPAGGARRSSSPPTTWTRHRTWPTAWR